MLRHTPGERGFSLLELVIVLVVIGVLSAAVSLRWGSSGDYSIARQADRFASVVRQIQVLNVTLDQSLRLDASSGAYSVRCVTGTGQAPCVAANDVVRDPATGELLNYALEDGAVLTGSALDFDSWGRPLAGAALATSPRTFTLSVAGKSYTVTISPVTGFVAVASP